MPLLALLSRLRSERGQSSVEYLGMVAVVVAVVGVIIAAAPGIGQSIVDAIGDQIDKILG
jgi:pilus assembly protein Flp/PilA